MKFLPTLPQYDTPSSPINLMNAGGASDMIGDPKRAAKAVFQISGMENLPLRIQLGTDALLLVRHKALKTVARLDGTPFPSSAQLAWRWVRGRVPQVRPRWRIRGGKGPVTEAALETAYCAEVVAVTYEDMGLLPRGQQPNWYDPGRFWSGDDLELADGFTLSDEIEVDIPAG